VSTPSPPLSAAHLGAVSTRRPAPPQPGIVHLGLGNFHRAHQAVYTDAAIDSSGGDWGIIGVANRSSAVVDAMREQDLLYTVVEISPAGYTFSVPRTHIGVFVGAREPERVLASIASRQTRIVTITVTEHGYTYSPSTGRLNLDDPLIQADILGTAAPQTIIGQIVRGLQQRMLRHGDPITILSCDNLAENGHHTRLLVHELVTHLGAAEATDLTAFLDTQVTFPSSMVDRIVPATTPHYRQLVADALGCSDQVPVPAEPFTMWVMEDDFAAGRPAWEAGGAVFSAEVSQYEQLKMRLLNGTHSLIAYLGALSGAATIPAAVALDFVEDAARAVLRNEYLPTVTVPKGVDVDVYEEQLFSRWRNTALGHKTSQVGSDGSVKLHQRVPDPAVALLDRGRMPHQLALTVAAYLTCLAPLTGFDPGPVAAAIQDPARSLLSRLAVHCSSGQQLTELVLGKHQLLGEQLAKRGQFLARTGQLVDLLHQHGPRTAARDAAGPPSTT
jgi:fructuronate reductase